MIPRRGKFPTFTIQTMDDDEDNLLIAFDGVESETMAIPQRVPDHALDTGRTVQEHVIEDPTTIDIVLVVSETPLPGIHARWRDAVDSETNSALTVSLSEGVQEVERTTRGYPLTAAGPERAMEVRRALADARRRLWTIHSERLGTLDSYQIVGINWSPSTRLRRVEVRLNLKKVTFATPQTVNVPKIGQAKKAQEAKKNIQITELERGIAVGFSFLESLRRNPGSAQGLGETAIKDLPENGITAAVTSIPGGF